MFSDTFWFFLQSDCPKKQVPHLYNYSINLCSILKCHQYYKFQPYANVCLKSHVNQCTSKKSKNSVKCPSLTGTHFFSHKGHKQLKSLKNIKFYILSSDLMYIFSSIFILSDVRTFKPNKKNKLLSLIYKTTKTNCFMTEQKGARPL